MTGCPAYLDSTDLVDLRTLFNEGVHRTDVLVILATKGVLTRPWCILEMWEAALTQVPIVLFPVVGGGWTPADARVLLGDLMGQMRDFNPTCMAEVMAHVGTQGVTDVHEVEDVLLAHIGLVPSVERAGRPASVALDARLCAHLDRKAADLGPWLASHSATVEQRLCVLSWQSWGSDNQIIASVQTLMGESAVAMGREPLEWKEDRQADPAVGLSRTRSSDLDRSQSSINGVVQRLVRHLTSGQTLTHMPTPRVLIVCALNECGGLARLLQQEFRERLQCEVVISTDQVDTWHSEVENASLGVVLLQVCTLPCAYAHAYGPAVG